ncbi:MAG TPA: hypothetical protein VE172_12985 [Stackebrandtia sp.]|jgi:hypothetical protein|uniref:hypothetical protein n=1 Tax=Stackebrandtia sp. TaxID=2023065 RepID=UPI002D47F2D4|nr:hypothetical protein [Stackebrandtia sp.]HZE39715.1 hypothetical protein [Stackebrandtia sp.]
MAARTRRFLLVAGLVGALTVAPVSAAHAAYDDPLTKTDGAGLTWHATSAAAIQKLDDALPNVDVAAVLDSANHPMTSCTSTEAKALPIKPASTVHHCWDSGDAGTTAWVPQGITTSGDADDDGAWGADRAMLSGWHYNHHDPADDSQWNGNNDRYNDARVAFIDYNDPKAPTYRWVYLVVPRDGGNTFSAAEGHTGGMVWYGDKLYVTEVGNRGTAIRVFSMSHILQANSAASDQIGQTGGEYAAYGYQYVMTQVGRYDYAGGTCTMDHDDQVPCFASISLDRSTSPDSLVSTEYFSDQSKRGRLYRYAMGADYLLKTDAGGTAASVEAYHSGVGNMQGVLSRNGKWYVAHSSIDKFGQLWAQNTSSSVSARCGSPATTQCWAKHPEALTYNVASDLVFSQTEWAPSDCSGSGQECGRVVFGVPFGAFG